MIVMDIEWNQGFGRLEEIIQLGAVRLSACGGRIESSFNAYIRPTVHRKFSVGAKKLPDLALSLTSEIDFCAAYRDFLAWCGEETEFAAWGRQDFGVLEKNAAFYDLPVPRMERCVDLQSAFGRTVGADRCLSLESAVTYCAIPETFSYHNARNDAMYTAIVSGYIDPACILTVEEEKTRRKERTAAFAQLSPDALPDALTKQFPKKKHCLNSRALRFVPCPVCARPLSLALWYPYDALTYYGVVKCGKHGRMLCRLALEDRKNSWVATRSVLAATGEEVEAYREAGKREPFRASAPRRSRTHHRRAWKAGT